MFLAAGHVSQWMVAPYMFDARADIFSILACAALAELTDTPTRASIFHFDAAANTCYLGEVYIENQNYTAMSPRLQLEFIDVYVRVSNQIRLDYKFQLFEPQPGSVWGPKIYKTVPAPFFKSCRATCHFDGEPCTLFVWATDTGDCHLGGENVQTSVVTDPTTRDMYFSERTFL